MRLNLLAAAALVSGLYCNSALAMGLECKLVPTAAQGGIGEELYFEFDAAANTATAMGSK